MNNTTNEVKTKACSKCKRELPADNKHFHKSSQLKSGLKPRCKECLGGKFGISHINRTLKAREGYKFCSKCEKELPANDNYFVKFKGGYFSQCKVCKGAKSYGVKIINREHETEEGFKICTNCVKELPATTEYFGKQKGCKDGLRPSCKECKKIRDKQYYEKNKEKILDHNHEYYKENKEEILEKQLKYYEENKEKILKQCAEYYDLNKKAIIEKQKEYYKEHEEEYFLYRRKYRKENKEKLNESENRWRKQNKDKVKLTHRRRRNKKKNVDSTLTFEQWEKIKKEFDYKCAYCGETVDTLEQDHFIPVSVGGEYTHNNIIPACRHCNASKNNRDFFNWYPKESFYSKQREQKILKYLNYKEDKTQQLALL